jgi:hypothetical protein
MGIQWPRDHKRDNDTARNDPIIYHKDYFVSRTNSIRGHLKDISKSVVAVVPVTPWHVHLCIRRQFSESVREAYEVPGYEMLSESDPVWEFWRNRFPHSHNWKPLALSHIQFAYHDVRRFMHKARHQNYRSGSTTVMYYSEI